MTGYKGVYFHGREKKWASQIVHQRKRQWLGYFMTAEAAHDAYVAKAAELFGEFARAA